jgi:hypothetical protein
MVGTTERADVLELRVHGVNNTPPASLLDLPQEKIERVLGDEVAGFWRARIGATDTLRPGDRGYTPPYVTREAYSWGGLARTSLGGGEGRASSLLGIAVRFGWMLLLPFGLANLAYWTRRLSDPADRSETSSGRGIVRLFAIGLTLLGVATAAELTLGLIATQCYPGGVAACGNWLSLVNNMFDGPHNERLVIAAVGPLVFLLVLWFLSARTSSRYERASAPQEFPAPTDAPDTVLGKPRFWTRDQLVEGLGFVHLAAGFSLIAVLLSLPAWEAPSSGARTAALVAAAGSLVVLSACCGSTITVSARGRPWAATPLLAVAVLVLGVAAGSMWLLPLPTDAVLELPWATWLPTILVVMLFAVLCTAFCLRSTKNSRIVALICLLVLTGVVIAGLMGPGSGWRDLLLLVPPAVFVAVWIRRLSERRAVAFSGGAPGVFLAIALYVALLESSLVLVGAGNLLNGNAEAADLAGEASGNVLTVALPYVLFAGASAVVSVMFALLLVIVAIKHLWLARAVLPNSTGKVDDGPIAARRVAALAHRAEKGVLALAVLEVAGLYVVVVLAIAGEPPWVVWPDQQGILRALSDYGFALLAFAAVVITGALVGASGRTRPLGLLWDLICFLPRSAHPFGPPCYAERAVPELAARVEEWLTPPRRDESLIETDRRHGRAVILSAHSLGAVLSVSVLLGRRRLGPDERPQVLLLTYGCQLRSYFGRILPELLGPDVLGTPRVRSASLWQRDPWQGADLDDAGDVSPLARRLTVPGNGLGWRSLWRRTDYLGFPVGGYVPNPLDRSASEEDRSGYLLQIGTHSDYPRVPEYDVALAELVAMAPEPRVSTGV